MRALNPAQISALANLVGAQAKVLDACNYSVDQTTDPMLYELLEAVRGEQMRLFEALMVRLPAWWGQLPAQGPMLPMQPAPAQGAPAPQPAQWAPAAPSVHGGAGAGAGAPQASYAGWTTTYGSVSGGHEPPQGQETPAAGEGPVSGAAHIGSGLSGPGVHRLQFEVAQGVGVGDVPVLGQGQGESVSASNLGATTSSVSDFPGLFAGPLSGAAPGQPRRWEAMPPEIRHRRS